MAMGYVYAGMAALQYAGGLFASQATAETARINQEISEMNAEFAELDAYDAKLEGYSEVSRYQTTIDATLGAQTAQLAAADVDTSFGSVASIQEETKFIAELNKLEIMNQASAKVLGYERQARDIRLGGYFDNIHAQQQASSQKTTGMFNAASTGLTGYQRTR